MKKSIFIPILISGISLSIAGVVVPQFHREAILTAFCHKHHDEMESIIANMENAHMNSERYGIMKIESRGNGCYEVFYEGFIFFGIADLYYSADGIARGDLYNLEEPAVLSKQVDWWCWERDGNHGKSKELSEGWFYYEASY